MIFEPIYHALLDPEVCPTPTFSVPEAPCTARCTGRLTALHDIADEVLGDVRNVRLFAAVEPDLLVEPAFGGAEAARSVVDLAVSGAEQRLVDARLAGQGVVATSGRPARYRAQPVRTGRALVRDYRRAPLRTVNTQCFDSTAVRLLIKGH